MHALALAAVSSLFVAAFAAWLYLAIAPRALRRAYRDAVRALARARRAPSRFRHGRDYHRAGKAKHALPPAPKTTPALTAARTA